MARLRIEDKYLDSTMTKVGRTGQFGLIDTRSHAIS